MGLAALTKRDTRSRGDLFREAIRSQPDLAEAHNNLGNLLAGRKAYREAAHHFEKAIESDPNYVEAHHSYGLVLALTRSYPQSSCGTRTVIGCAAVWRKRTSISPTCW